MSAVPNGSHRVQEGHRPEGGIWETESEGVISLSPVLGLSEQLPTEAAERSVLVNLAFADVEFMAEFPMVPRRCSVRASQESGLHHRR